MLPKKIIFIIVLFVLLTLGAVCGLVGCSGGNGSDSREDEVTTGPVETFTAFQNAAKIGSVDEAVNLFTDSSKGQYRALIEDLLAKGRLQAWAEEFERPELVSMSDSTAIIVVSRNINNVTLTVEIYLTKEDGVWRIDRM